MEKTLTTLKDINYYGSLNSLDTIYHVINKLPFDVRCQWVKESVVIEPCTGYIVNFACLVKFISNLLKKLTLCMDIEGLVRTILERILRLISQNLLIAKKTLASSYKVKASSKKRSTESSNSTAFVPFLCFYFKDPTNKILECNNLEFVTVF